MVVTPRPIPSVNQDDGSGTALGTTRSEDMPYMLSGIVVINCVEATHLPSFALVSPISEIPVMPPSPILDRTMPLGCVHVKTYLHMFPLPIRSAFIAWSRLEDQRPSGAVVVLVATSSPVARYTGSFVGPVMCVMALTVAVEPIACQVTVTPLYVAPPACIFTKLS
jgi:hypothetical protein